MEITILDLALRVRGTPTNQSRVKFSKKSPVNSPLLFHDSWNLNSIKFVASNACMHYWGRSRVEYPVNLFFWKVPIQKYGTRANNDVIYKIMKFQGLLKLKFIRLLFSGPQMPYKLCRWTEQSYQNRKRTHNREPDNSVIMGRAWFQALGRRFVAWYTTSYARIGPIF